jgi:hypothetical protein
MDRIHGNVFEFVRDDFEAMGKFLKSGPIRKIACDARRDPAHWGFW